MEPQARQLMADCVDKNMIDKNMIDKDEYPQTVGGACPVFECGPS